MAIEVGSTVRLKSGGPLMSVEHIFTDTEGNKAACTWFPITGDIQYEPLFAETPEEENFSLLVLTEVPTV